MANGAIEALDPIQEELIVRPMNSPQNGRFRWRSRSILHVSNKKNLQASFRARDGARRLLERT
jgi:hypothetical protein